MLCKHEGCPRESRSGGASFCNLHANRYRSGKDMDAPFRTPNGEAFEAMKSICMVDQKDCLIWNYARTPNGYAGWVYADGKRILAPHLALLLTGRERPSPIHQAAHSCGKGHEGCVNPKHLRWATPKENNADKIAHGTLRRGSAHQNSKMTEADAALIKSLLREGILTHREIGAKVGRSREIVSHIKQGKIWRHVIS